MKKISSYICSERFKEPVIAILFLLLFVFFCLNQINHTSMELGLCTKQECTEQDLVIDLIIDTNQFEVIATDSVIEFDQNKLAFIGLKDHQVFHKTLIRQIKDGYIELSSFKLPPATVKGRNKIASLYFRVLRDGETDLRLKYSPKEVLDSNIIGIYKDEDILGTTKNLKVTLKKP